jgi:hypothetical protein
MLRRVCLTIAYFVAVVYILSILMPAVYCLQHGCKGPGELDAFMPAFMLTPVGAIGTAFSLHNAIQNIRKRSSWSPVFWLPAIVFAVVLLGIIAFVAILICEGATHR